MTEKEFLKIMEQDSGLKCDDDNAVLGLLLIRKYIPKAGIEGAEHDMICSVCVDDLVKAGITKEDVLKLRNELNWMVEQEEYLACCV